MMPQYAVNLGSMMELTRKPADLPLLLLLRGIVTDQAICTESGKDAIHTAVLVKDDVSAERWQAIVTLIRKKYRYNQFPLYEKADGRWKKLR